MIRRGLAIAVWAVVSVGALPAVAYETNVNGFPGTKWGMSEREVQAAIKGKLTHWTSRSDDGKEFPHFGIRNYDIDGCNFYVDFEFTESKLSRVSLNLDGDTQIKCPTQIATILTGKYGQPKSDEHTTVGINSRHRKWFVGATRIEQHEYNFASIGTVMLSVDYFPTRTSSAGKL